MKYKRTLHDVSTKERLSIIQDRTPSPTHRPASLIALSAKYCLSQQNLSRLFEEHLTDTGQDLTHHPSLVKKYENLR